MSQIQLFARLAKVDVEKRQVTGVIASETPDAANEIFDYDTSKPNFQKWSGNIAKMSDGKSVGNVRAMHSNIAAGLLSDITFDDVAKTISVTADVVDDNEWNKVLKGVYTGFSIGGRYVKKWADKAIAKAKRYTADPTEVSLVDIGCNPDATFTMVKADGMESEVRFEDTEAGVLHKLADPETPAEERVELVRKLADFNGVELAKAEGDGVVGEPEEEELEKGGYSIGELAQLADRVACFLSYSGFSYNMDGTTTLKSFGPEVKQAATLLYDALLKLVAEDVEAAKSKLKEIKKLLDEEGEPLRKAQALGEFVGKEFAVEDDGAHHVHSSEGLGKFLGTPADIEALTKFIGEHAELKKKLDDAEARNAEIDAQLAKLMEQPAPAKGVKTIVVGKETDGTGVAKAVAVPEPEEKDPLVLIKRIHSQGGQSITPGNVLAKKQ